MSRHVVATVGEIPENGRKLVEVKGRRIALVHVNGEYLALTDRCPHEGGSLCAGRLIGPVRSREPGRHEHSRPNEMPQCSWHGWEFDIRTGRSWCDPGGVRARTCRVFVEPGEALARGPLAAESFPVPVENRAILIEV